MEENIQVNIPIQPNETMETRPLLLFDHTDEGINKVAEMIINF